MSDYAVKADRFVLPGYVATGGYLVISGGVFGTWSAEAPEGMEVVDRGGRWVVPGYVDTHIHGQADHDVMDCDAAGVNEASLALARRGTTSWTPTTLTQPRARITSACASVYEASESRDDDFPGARIEGIYLEGPFFTERHCGAQNPAHMFDPSVEAFREWQEAAHGLICKSALAPERKGSQEYCATLADLGVACVLGHSDASYEQALAAVAAGASCFVHTYNGMSGLHHRDPGLVGAAMSTVGTYAEVICDGKHVLPGAVKALVDAKGWEHTVIVSDALACAGMPDGDYVLGDLPIRLGDDLAHLILEDDTMGSVAGSVTCVAQEVKNLVDWGIVTAEQAVRMGSEIPARSAGVDDVCGLIRPGRCADFNVLGLDLTLEETYVGGVLVQ